MHVLGLLPSVEGTHPIHSLCCHIKSACCHIKSACSNCDVGMGGGELRKSIVEKYSALLAWDLDGSKSCSFPSSNSSWFPSRPRSNLLLGFGHVIASRHYSTRRPCRSVTRVYLGSGWRKSTINDQVLG